MKMYYSALVELIPTFLFVGILWLTVFKSTTADLDRGVYSIDDIVFGEDSDFTSWSDWSSWSDCSATCDGSGTQVRYKKCHQERYGSDTCSGREIVETRPCGERYCEPPQCETSGTITDASGIALSGVELVLGGSRQGGKALTVSNENGFFSVDGICANTESIHLVARKNNYVASRVSLAANASGIAMASAKLLREVKPTIYQHPQSKVRLAGQNVKFCCRARGNQKDLVYYWHHNGTLVNPAMYSRDPGTLEIRNLRLDDAGSYKCKVESRVSYKKRIEASQISFLTVAESESSICPQRPSTKLVPIPSECAVNGITIQKVSSKTFFDIGTCSNSICPSAHSQEACGELSNTTTCCGPTEREEIMLNCIDFTLPVQRVTKCGCQKCAKPITKIRGRAYASDSGDPLRYGYVSRGGKRMTVTGFDGTFSAIVPVETERLVLTFEDRFGKLMSTTKVLTLKKNGGITYHQIKMKRKAPIKTFNSQEKSVTELNGVSGQPPVANVVTAPGSFYTKNGIAYTGKVQASVTFIDPRNESSYEESPTDLSFVSDDGESLPLQTFGMFEMDFRDSDMNELDIGKAKLVLDQNQFASSAYGKKLKLWSLNPENGMWEEEEGFQEMGIDDDAVKPGPKRKKRETQTFLVGNLEVRERRLFNLDVPVENRCWMKVRVYRSPDFNPDEQVEDVEVTAINMEPTAGIRGNPQAWGQFYSAFTAKEGACLRVLCHSDTVDAYKATVMAKLDDSEELEAASSSFPIDPDIVGVRDEILRMLDYRRSDHSVATGKKTSFQTNLPKPKPDSVSIGPIYAAEDYVACEQAPVTDNHFRFYRTEDFLYEYNTIYMDEHNCITWTPSYLNWWPSHIVYTACYIKVNIYASSPRVVRVKSLGGTHPETAGKLYGIRDDRSVYDKSNENKFISSSAACVEFKCSGPLYDEEVPDRTLVSVVPQGDCSLRRLNGKLNQYLTEHPPAVEGASASEFRMYAPEDCLDHNYGIYSAADDDPLVAKKRALENCYAGSSDVTLRIMHADKGVAAYYLCRNEDDWEETEES